MENQISLASAMQLTESLLQEVRQSKTRGLIAMLGSTFLLYSSFRAVEDLSAGPYSYGGPLRALVLASVVCNTAAWLAWLLPGIALLTRNLVRGRPRGFRLEDMESTSAVVIEQHQWAMYQHRKQLMKATLVEVLLSAQFISMGLCLAFFASTGR